MEEQAAIDRILETENLTDGLEDDDANWLLDWGINLAPGLIGGLDDEELAGTQVNRLMAVMRKLNTLVADRQARPAEELSGLLADLASSYRLAFGQASPSDQQDGVQPAAQIEGQAEAQPGSQAEQDLLTQLPAMSPLQALRALAAWLEAA